MLHFLTLTMQHLRGQFPGYPQVSRTKDSHAQSFITLGDCTRLVPTATALEYCMGNPALPLY